MEVITDIVRNVVTLVLVFSCLELFLPAGEMSRFVRLGFALILLALIIIPSAQALSRTDWRLAYISGEPAAGDNYAQKSAELTALLEQAARDDYESELAQHLAAAACLVPGVLRAQAAAETDANGALLTVELDIVAAAGTGVTAGSIRDSIRAYWPVSEENIHMEIREEQP